MSARISICLTVLGALLALPALVTAQANETTAQAPPFVDGATVAQGRFDISAVNVDGMMASYTDLLKQMNVPKQELEEILKEINQQLAQVRKVLADFRSAGGKKIWVSTRLTPEPAVFLAIPIEPGGDGKKLGDVVKKVIADAQAGAPQAAGQPFANAQAEVVKNHVIIADPKTVSVVKQIEPAARPDVARAMASAGNSPAVIALVPNAAVRLGIVNMMPKLPDALGGGPITPVSQGIQWVAISFDQGPQPAMRLVIQAQDADNAKKLRGIFDTGAKQLPPSPEMQKMVEAMTPVVAGDKLTLTIDTPKMTSLSGILLPALNKARESATRAKSANNIRQVLLGVHMYANEHNGQLPKDLGKDLPKYLQDPTGQLWVNPSDPTRRPGYVWLRPADNLLTLPNAEKTVLLYEAFDKWPGFVSVGFADAHVEGFEDEKEFRALVPVRPMVTKPNAPAAAPKAKP